MLVGAIAQSFPDIDVVGTLWLTLPQNLYFHRGITHSLLFGFFVAFLLAFITQKIFRNNQLSFKKLVLFFCLQMWLHDMLDTCNAYGTGLLEPFSAHRFSFNLLFVADPFFTFPMIIASIVLLYLKTGNPVRRKWIFAGLILPCFYIVYAISNKISVDRRISNSIHEQQIQPEKFISTPTAFNTWLWYIMIPRDNGVYIGYRSVFDDKKYITPFQYFPKKEYLLSDREASDDVKNLKKLANGIYVIEKNHDSLIFAIPRFGRIAGWENTPTAFGFQYYLNKGLDNTLLIQRGRAKELNKKTFTNMYNRILGVRE